MMLLVFGSTYLVIVLEELLICETASLQETNTLNELKPASEEKRTLSSDDDDEHFKDIHFPPDSALQQVSL